MKKFPFSLFCETPTVQRFTENKNIDKENKWLIESINGDSSLELKCVIFQEREEKTETWKIVPIY